MANRPPLNPNQLKALDMLADGMTNGQVAGVLKVNRQTVWGWHKRSEFAQELEKRQVMRRNVLQKAINDKAMSAVDVLEEVMLDDTAKHADRLRAASILLDKARPMLTETTDFKKTETVELACWVTNKDVDGSKPEFIEVGDVEAAK